MSDQLNPPAYVDRWWPVQKKRNDRERHHDPDERSIERCNLDHSVPGGEESTYQRQTQTEKQKHGGPTKGDSKMHENAVRFIANTVSVAGSDLNGRSASTTYIVISWP